MITYNQSPAVKYVVTKNTLWQGFVLPILLLLSAFAIATAAYILMDKLAGVDQSFAEAGTELGTDLGRKTEPTINASATSAESPQGIATRPATLVLIRNADAVKYKANKNNEQSPTR